MNLSNRESSCVIHQKPSDAIMQVFYQAWAQRYISQMNQLHPELIFSGKGCQEETILELRHALNNLCVRASEKTKDLIAKAVLHRQTNAEFIDLWSIAQDVDRWSITQDIYRIYETTLKQYSDGIQANNFAINMAQMIGHIRNRYVAHDPRVLGIVRMQFHYTGQLLLTCAHGNYPSDLELYFKVISDCLYMPLERACNAVGTRGNNAPEIKAIQRLIPISSKIAHKIVEKVLVAFPHYYSHSGPLASSLIRTSSVRDIEMFQVYLWICVLEGNAAVLQQELFPLCAMLYPILNVRWELVSYMLMLLEHELGRWLEPSQWKQFRPHLETLKVMFSTTVVSNQLCLAS